MDATEMPTGPSAAGELQGVSPALISGGRVSQRTAGRLSRKRVPETSGVGGGAGGGDVGLSIKRDGWMSCWKKRQKKWSRRGELASQNALEGGRGGVTEGGMNMRSERRREEYEE